MKLRTCTALLFLLSACATTEPQKNKPKQYNQLVAPWLEPLVMPKPIAPVLPAPVGLTPPVAVMVDPGGEMQQEPEANPTPEKSRANRRGPPAPVTAERRRPECEPRPVSHAGEDDAHNECADKYPPNRYPGNDVLVDGKRFDALQVGARVLWEIKTHRFDTYNAFIQRMTILEELPLLQEERDKAEGCGYGFVVGVSTQAHKDALLAADQSLTIVVTGCKR
jgi:hypothetical protein